INNQINIIVNRKQEFNKSNIKDDWKKGKISNFEYLMQINSYSGRSFNDLGQYPVFPWVLSNYKSEQLDLENENFYRKLNIPIGAINRERFVNHYLQRFKNSTPFDKETYFMYGTHYSNPTIVLTLLMRMEPFAGLHFKQQANKFDKADRLFHSIQELWDSCQNNSADVKELLPEFYYLPDFLYNINDLFLGKKQDNTQVDQVILPEWIQKSTNTPEEFIFRMRQALESPYVSLNLHYWIDLIFGSKQSGQKSIQFENVFHPSSYDQNLNLDGMNESFILAEKAKIQFFGQVPYKLFDEDQKPKDENYNWPKITEFEFYSKLDIKYESLKCEFSLDDVILTDKFHCIDICQDFLVCGSKDCRVSISTIEIKKNNILGPELELNSTKMLYGHHNEVTAVKINKSLQIIVSIDLDGLKHIFYTELQDNEFIQFLEIHEMGYILIVTCLKRLIIFTLNGNKFLEINLSQIFLEVNENITGITFLSNICSYIYIGTCLGSIYYFDFFEVKAKITVKYIFYKTIKYKAILQQK
ncbi:WD repeat and fyve domain protein 3, partial [Ichthyophthirius multifiliis]